MPYIDKDWRRGDLDELMDDLRTAAYRGLLGGAELNYVLSRIAGAYLMGEASQMRHQKPNYRDRVETLAHLKAFVREFERRNVDNYEDTKITDETEIPEYREANK